MTETSITELSRSWFLLIKDHLKLMRLESELAQVSLFPLLISGLTLTILAAILWMLLLVLMGYCLYLWGLTALMCILAVLMINVTALFICFLKFVSYKNRISFEHTRSRLKEIFK